jgi:hypothetical protein
MPFQQGYDPTEAQICMTLSSLAYVSENDPPNIKQSLISQLQNPNYSTQNQWALAWGPALSADEGNLMYVVQNTVQENLYALAVRGTDPCFLSNLEEDLEAWKQVEYPYSNPPNSEVMIAEGTLQGVQELLSLAAPNTLSNFFSSLSSSTQPIYLYITGHSLGGALATLLSSWALDTNSQWSNNFNFKTYTFAAPSIGNPAYASYFQQQLQGAGTESYRVWNTSDVVPYFWDNYIQLPYLNYPGYSMPWRVFLTIIGITGAIDYYFNKYDIQYTPVNISHPFDNSAQYTPCAQMPANTTEEMLEQYACYVGHEHASATYLGLVGAQPVSYIYIPNCPPPAVPQREPNG